MKQSSRKANKTEAVTKQKVLDAIKKIESGMSERAACQEIGINRLTFRSAVLREKAVDQYAQALAALAHDQAEKMEQAIDDMRNGVIDHHMARVEIDARKWFASKFLPKQYGDKPDVTITNNVAAVAGSQQPVPRNNAEIDEFRKRWERAAN